MIKYTPLPIGASSLSVLRQCVLIIVSRAQGFLLVAIGIRSKRRWWSQRFYALIEKVKEKLPDLTISKFQFKSVPVFQLKSVPLNFIDPDTNLILLEIPVLVKHKSL